VLGLVKHSATWEARYFGEVFDRPFREPLPRRDDEAAYGTDADILREQLDGAVGTDPRSAAGRVYDAEHWERRRARIERAARAADPAGADSAAADFIAAGSTATDSTSADSAQEG
jgi:hypothetical protein